MLRSTLGSVPCVTTRGFYERQRQCYYLRSQPSPAGTRQQDYPNVSPWAPFLIWPWILLVRCGIHSSHSSDITSTSVFVYDAHVVDDRLMFGAGRLSCLRCRCRLGSLRICLQHAMISVLPLGVVALERTCPCSSVCCHGPKQPARFLRYRAMLICRFVAHSKIPRTLSSISVRTDGYGCN